MPGTGRVAGLVQRYPTLEALMGAYDRDEVTEQDYRSTLQGLLNRGVITQQEYEYLLP